MSFNLSLLLCGPSILEEFHSGYKCDGFRRLESQANVFSNFKKKNQMSINSLYVIVCVIVVFVWGSLLYERVLVWEIWDTYILLDDLLCSIAEYFYELCRILASP